MFPQLPLDQVRTISIEQRDSKVRASEFASVFDPVEERFPDFLRSLPDVLKAAEMKQISRQIVASRKKGYPVIWFLGAHVIKVGLAPVVIDLMRSGFITAVAMNSAAAIHDVETALFGVTSEDVAEALTDGSFGMSRETGEFINRTLTDAYTSQPIGYGEALGLRLMEVNAPHGAHSILETAVRLRIPASIHAAIGTDIVHQQPTMNGAATGELSFRDFRVLCASVKDVRGGVVLNIGSAVILPEVFLKALTVVRNLGYPADDFLAANFDMIQHYRPRMNVVDRPTRAGGTGLCITGHHEIMIPLLAAMIKWYATGQ